MGTPLKENNSVPSDQKDVEPYGKVIITLKNCTLPEDKLDPTPSSADGLESDVEIDLRILGCELIQTAGILLKLPQVAMATAQVLFHRFYYSKSFVRQNYEVTGMGCLYLASKIEEAPRRIRDVVNVYHHIKQVYCKRKLTPMLLDQNYVNLKYQVIKAERRVLKELGFCVHVKHPHKLIVTYLQTLGLETKQTIMQMAWNYMNDSLRTDVFVRYQPETIACACIYLSSRKLKIPLPKSPAWWAIFNVTETDIQDVCLRILRLYQRSKPSIDELEKKIQALCKKFEESRMRFKANLAGETTSGNNTPNNVNNSEKKSKSPRRRSRSQSASPRYKRSKRSRSRTRSRSRSPDRYKKGYKSRRSTRSPTPNNKRDKRHRSRSRSYEEKITKGGKYVSDRYKEDRYYDKYRRDDDRYYEEEPSSKYRSSRNDDDSYSSSKYRSSSSARPGDDDSKYYSSKKENRSKDYYDDSKFAAVKKVEEEKYRSTTGREITAEEENYRKRKAEQYREFRDRLKDHKEDENAKSNRKEDSVKKGKDERRSKSKHSSSKHKGSEEKLKRKKKKHHMEDLDDDDIEIIHIKKEKKAR